MIKTWAGPLIDKLRSGSTAKVFGIGVTNALLGLAMTTLLARTLEPHNFGIYSLLLSVLTIASFPIASGLRQVSLRETAYAVANEEASRLRFIWLWCYKVAALLCFVVSAAVIVWMTGTGGIGNVVIAVSLVMTLFAIPFMHIAVGAVQGLGRVVVSQFPEYLIRPGGALLIVGLVAVADRTRPLPTEVAVVSYALMSVVAAGAAFFWMRSSFRMSRLHAAAKTVPGGGVGSRPLIWAAVNFGLIASVQLVTDNVDTLMLGYLNGPTEVGYYRVATALGTLASFAIIAINTVISPEIARLHARDARNELQKLISSSTKTITFVSLAIFFVILFGGNLLIVILFGFDYTPATIPLYIISFGRFINSCMGPVATVMSLTGHERLTLAGLCLSAASNILLNLVLIPSFGAVGAAIATAISMVIWGAFLWIALRRTTGLTTALWER